MRSALLAHLAQPGPGGRRRFGPIALRVAGKSLGLGVMSLALMFFAEHAQQWLIGPLRDSDPATTPAPPIVLAVLAAHGLAILGYALSLRFERVGPAVTIAGVLGFGGLLLARGSFDPSLLAILGACLVPPMLVLLGARPRRRPQPAS